MSELLDKQVYVQIEILKIIFRGSKCQDIPSLFPSIPIMALSATVTLEITAKLQNFLQNPTVEKGSVYRQNIFLPVLIQITKGQSRYDSSYIYNHA